jgi:dihydrofolate reductase
MGRTTYEVVRAMGGDWPYAGKRSYVVTLQALPDLPPQTEIRPADFTALAAELRQHQDGDVWLLGGGSFGWVFSMSRRSTGSSSTSFRC